MEEKVTRTQPEHSGKPREPIGCLREPGQGEALFNNAILVGLALILMATPVALGSVALWARCTVFCAMLLLFAGWFLRGARSGRLSIARSWVWVPMGAFFLLGALQLVPLNGETLSFLSPGTAATYAKLLPNSGHASRTLSLFPYGTRMALLHAASLALMFFLVTHTVQRRRDAVILILALLAIGVFEALYGFGEQFSGSQRVFWQERRAHLAAVTGTFFNKNHFAGMLAMILPLALGFLMTLLPRERRAGTLRARLLYEASSSRMPQFVILPVAIIILATGICFSLSRAGIICSLIAMIAFAICMGLTIGFRKYTLLLLALMTAILLVAVGIGSELIVERMEDAASGHSASWADRLDLSRSGWQMFKEFPLFGAGLGSFRYAFERFQSARFGDRVADYLHNDWLQILCEMGIVGGVAVLSGLVVLVVGTARQAFSRKDAFCKWVALGALVGVGAMVIHSLFDYNLYKITSNGLIFAALLGLAFSVARMPSERSDSPDRRAFFTLRLGPAPIRVCLAVLVLIGAAFAVKRPLSIAACDIEFNRYLAHSGIDAVDPYFFLPAGQAYPSIPGSDLIARAKRFDPSNPKYDYYESVFLGEKAQDLVLEQATESARKLLGSAFSTMDEEASRRITDALSAGLANQPSPPRTALLRQEEAALRNAIRRLPVFARYHITLAQTLGQIEESSAATGAVHNNALESPVPHARRAVWCAPRKPAVLFASGMTLLMHSLTQGTVSVGQEDINDATAYFRRAILADPSYAPRIYKVVRSTSPEDGILARVTPKTLRSYSYLCRTLWDEGAWEELLACLDVLDDLVAQTEERRGHSWAFARFPGNGKYSSEGLDLATHAELSHENLDELHVLRTKLQALQLRCEVLAILGRAEERQEAVAAYRHSLHEESGALLADAQAWALRHRYNNAMRKLIQALEKDWSNSEALLTAAETSLHHGALNDLPSWNQPLDFFYRLIIHNEQLRPETLGRIEEILGRLKMADAEDRFISTFITGAAKILAGHADAGVQQLETIVQGRAEGFSTWRQQHLVWQYIGDGNMALGKPDQAAAAYAKAIALVPNHGPALERISRLDPNYETRLANLRPSVPCKVAFGGRIVFLGYDLTREAVPVNIQGPGLSLPEGMTVKEEKWFITYYWQIRDRLETGYRPSVQFCDEDWNMLFRDDHYFSTADGPYQTDFPKSGEIIIEKRALKNDPTDARYLCIGIHSPAPPEPLSHNMPCDNGHGTFVTSLVLGEESEPVATPENSAKPTAYVDRSRQLTTIVSPLQVTPDPVRPRR